jgi:hypothetical protein
MSQILRDVRENDTVYSRFPTPKSFPPEARANTCTHRRCAVASISRVL